MGLYASLRHLSLLFLLVSFSNQKIWTFQTCDSNKPNLCPEFDLYNGFHEDKYALYMSKCIGWQFSSQVCVTNHIHHIVCKLFANINFHDNTSLTELRATYIRYRSCINFIKLCSYSFPPGHKRKKSIKVQLEEISA